MFVVVQRESLSFRSFFIFYFGGQGY